MAEVAQAGLSSSAAAAPSSPASSAPSSAGPGQSSSGPSAVSAGGSATPPAAPPAHETGPGAGPFHSADCAYWSGVVSFCSSGQAKCGLDSIIPGSAPRANGDARSTSELNAISASKFFGSHNVALTRKGGNQPLSE